MVYRGTRDGFRARDFHGKCDNIFPSLVLIRSSQPQSQIFGGYTSKPWNSQKSYSHCSQSFLFSITNLKKIKVKNPGRAILCNQDFGPNFGGTDLFIDNNCNITNTNFTEVGTNYETLQNEDGDGKLFLGGTHSFKIDEIEIFKVSLPPFDILEYSKVVKNQIEIDMIEGWLINSFIKGSTAGYDSVNDLSPSKSIININSSSNSATSDSKAIEASPSNRNVLQPNRSNSNSKISYRLLYRGSLDNYSANEFHDKCDHIPNTLVLVKVKDTGNVFGGFAGQPWSSNDKYTTCSESFLFSLTSKRKCEIMKSKYAIYGKRNYGPIFGSGYDLCIVDKCNQSTSNHSFIGETYKVEGLVDSSKFLAGKENFLVEEIEVYSVLYTN